MSQQSFLRMQRAIYSFICCSLCASAISNSKPSTNKSIEHTYLDPSTPLLLTAMRTSPGKAPLSRKDFNSHASPAKLNSSLLHSSHNKTLNSNTETSYAKNSGGVSYGELQIILENVKNIKAKASQQVRHLEKKNQSLAKEAEEAHELVRRYENLEETIQKEKKNIEVKYQGEIMELRRQLEDEQQTRGQMEQQAHAQQREIERLNIVIKQTESSLLKSECALEDITSRYEQITGKLGVNEASHQIKTIASKYGSLPDLMAAFSTLQTNFENLKRQYEGALEVNQEQKEQISNNTRIIDTVTEENRSLVEKIHRSEDLQSQLQGKIQALQEAHDGEMQTQRQAVGQVERELRDQIREREAEIGEKQRVIRELRERVSVVEGERMKLESQEHANKEEAFFKSMVEEVCDQFADYRSIIKRVEYLEKYRSEHYFNVEKIQYLCKMLDS